MLAFVMLWAYFSFSQYLIIWSGNLPRGDRLVPASRCRPAGASSALALVAVPFRRAVRAAAVAGGQAAAPTLIVKVAAGILVVRLVDLFWLIAPEFHRDGLSPSAGWTSLLPLSLGVDLAGAVSSGSCAGRAILPVHDPQFDEALGAIIERGGEQAGDGALKMANLPRSHVAQDFSPAAPGVHHETSDVNVSAVFVFGLGLTSPAPSSSFVVWLPVRSLRQRARRDPARAAFPLAAEQQNRLPPEPRLQTNPRQDLLDLRAGEDAVLNTYGWVDKTDGVVRIPIDEAMRLTVAARAARATDGEAMTRVCSTQRTPWTQRIRSVSPLCVLCVHCVGPAAGGGADDRRAGGRLQARAWAAGVDRYRRLCGRSASTRTSIGAFRSTRHFVDEAGRAVRLGDYFGKRPVVLVFVYYDCPMLCTQVINGLASALGVLSLEPGHDFEIVTVSFDPRETPATGRREEGRVPASATSGRAPRAPGTS